MLFGHFGARSVAGVPEPLPRSHLIAYGAVLLAVVVLGVRALGDDSPTPPPAKITFGSQAAGTTEPGPDPRATAAQENPVAAAPVPTPAGSVAAGGGQPAARVTVHVAGAVRRPGLYRLAAGSLVDDAITRAGGPTRRAELSAINLAARAEDGRQILVPARGSKGAPAPAAPAPASPGSPDGAQRGPVNLNTATLEELDTLDGVGPTTAQKILDHREANGGFRSVDELDQIPGIGEKRMAALREQVTV